MRKMLVLSSYMIGESRLKDSVVCHQEFAEVTATVLSATLSFHGEMPFQPANAALQKSRCDCYVL